MSSRLHLTRSAVAASVCAVLAVTTAGAAAARSLERSRVEGRVRDAAVVDGRAQTAAARTRTVSAAEQISRSATGSGAPTTRRTPATPAPARRTVTIRRYADAPGSQRAIDACRLVLWTARPLWLAGHNYCGYQWLAYVRTGTVVVVPSGRAAGRYVVTGHLRLSRQSGSLPQVHADLVLQTCVGRSTGLTLTRRLG